MTSVRHWRIVGAMAAFVVAGLGGVAAEAPATAAVELGGGATMDFVLVPAGSFQMGSSDTVGGDDESPAHRVTITRAFYLGKYEVTQAQWRALMGDNPSHFKGDTLPVETVSWNDCQRFLAQLHAKTGRDFTLPTEAQWEYACRAGSTARWCFGDDEARLPEYAWCGANSGGRTHPVGMRRPNAWGLYDMHGNVGEWTADWYEKHAYDRGDVSDPQTPRAPGHSPVWRGGAWGDDADMLRCGYRNVNGADAAHWGIGFRCVMLLPHLDGTNDRGTTPGLHPGNAGAPAPASARVVSGGSMPGAAATPGSGPAATRN